MASPTTPTNPPPSNSTCKTTTTTTTTTLSTSTSLASSPHLAPLTTLINTTFAHSHAKHPLLIPPSQLRLSTPQQLLSELGPNGFTLIIHSSAADPTPIATVSCKPWAPPDASQPAALTNAVAAASRNAAALAAATTMATTATPTHETTPPAPDEAALFRSSHRPSTPPSSSSASNTTAQVPALPAWEFFAMAVCPHHQSRGLASQLLLRVVEEVRARSAVSVPVSVLVTTDNGNGYGDGDGYGYGDDIHKNKDGGEVESSSWGMERMGRVRLTCSTARAFNEGFYLKKGFRTTRTMWVERGVYGSEEGFEVVDMEMVV